MSRGTELVLAFRAYCVRACFELTEALGPPKIILTMSHPSNRSCGRGSSWSSWLSWGWFLSTYSFKWPFSNQILDCVIQSSAIVGIMIDISVDLQYLYRSLLFGGPPYSFWARKPFCLAHSIINPGEWGYQGYAFDEAGKKFLFSSKVRSQLLLEPVLVHITSILITLLVRKLILLLVRTLIGGNPN